MLPAGTIWNDVLPAAIVAVVGGAVAAFWPWFQSYWRGRKFEGIIRRELAEIGPFPLEPQSNTPWWEYLRKRFVHEEVFVRNQVAASRDFLLSLDPDVVYKVSQLWIAYEKRDARQWLHYLGELASDNHVGSQKLRNACGAWTKLLNADCVIKTEATGREDEGASAAPLLEARLQAYGRLLPLTRYGPENQPDEPTAEERQVRVRALMDWFYDDGGLLLSSEAHVAFRMARDKLAEDRATNAERWTAFSALRTELKIDLGVRHADVRDVPMAERGAAPRRPGG
jgi:hypothetical protein